MIKVLYPGSFDPITKGHMNIAKQASEIFDGVVVAIMKNPAKKDGFFTLEERYEMIKEIYKDINNIEVIIGSGAAVDVAILNKCKLIIRGLRGLSDLDDEFQLRQTNKEISDGKVNTMFLAADPEYQYLSSSKVKGVFSLGKDVSKYVDPIVNEKMLIKKRGI